MKDEALSPAASLSKQAFTRLSEASLELKRSSGRHSLLHGGIDKTISDGLDRTSSQVSNSSLDSNQSVASNSSAAAKWSPRTANAGTQYAKKPKSVPGHRRNAIHSTLSPQGSTTSLDLPDSPERTSSSDFIAAGRVQSAQTQGNIKPQFSGISSPRRTGSAALPSQHSILDPLPEQPTDIVRQRKVFGSTFSVGKLGELPYTPLPRERGSLTQPPWVAAAARQAASETHHQRVLSSEAPVHTGSTIAELQHAVTSTQTFDIHVLAPTTAALSDVDDSITASLAVNPQLSTAEQQPDTGKSSC